MTAADVDRLVAVLEAGQLAVVPTDTVYGLAARAADPSATRALFTAKGRGSDIPIAVLCADAGQALALTDAPSPELRAVADRWWPGPLTLVARRHPTVTLDLGEPSHTIGLRVPDHDLVRAVAGRIGPLATTSANRHGRPTPATAAEAAASLIGPVAMVVDGGPLMAAASTVLDTTVWPWSVLREGSAPSDEVLADAATARDGAG